MQNVKNKINEYIENKISLKDFNTYLRENVPFNLDGVIEDIRYDADMTIEGKLTENDKKEELLDEKTLKSRLKEYLNLL